LVLVCRYVFFFFQAEDGIRDFHVTGVQTCALPICSAGLGTASPPAPRGSAPTRPRPRPAPRRPARQGAANATVVRSSALTSGRRSEERRVGKECRPPGAPGAKDKQQTQLLAVAQVV